jgi:hypothetical protein
MMGKIIDVSGRQVPPPRDALGNELVKEMLVAVQLPFIPIFKIVSIEHGGIATPNGPTPAAVRIVSDFTLRQLPGSMFNNLVKVALPSHEKVIESIADLLGKS